MPAPHIATDRLRFRPFAPDDGDVLRALWAHPDVRRYLWDDVVVGPDVVRDVIAASERDFDADGFGLWLLFFPDEATLAGFCGFRHEPMTAEVELVYGIDPGHWGQGLATEAGEGALAFAFDEVAVEDVVAGSDAPNGASLRVLHKLGMRERRRFRRRGLPHEQVYLGLTVLEYRERHPR